MFRYFSKSRRNKNRAQLGVMRVAYDEHVAYSRAQAPCVFLWAPSWTCLDASGSALWRAVGDGGPGATMAPRNALRGSGLGCGD